MAPIVTLLLIVTISLLATRVGAIALMLTGLSPEIARFQARSAFTGVGFTTGEAEYLVNHPVRRRILMLLMFWGNIGVAAVIASTIASFALVTPWSLGVLAAGALGMWIVFASRIIDRWISFWMEYALTKFTSLDVNDYTSLLHLHNGYVVMEIQVATGDWIDGKTLAQAKLAAEGVLVLGVTLASSKYLGSPNGDTLVSAGDVLTVYGPNDRLEELDIRQEGAQGDRAHRIAMHVQQEIENNPKVELEVENPPVK